MTFEKKKWNKYTTTRIRNNNSQRIIEIKLKDEGEKEVEILKANDQKGYSSISWILKEKWGIDMTPLKDKEKEKKEFEEEMEFLNSKV